MHMKGFSSTPELRCLPKMHTELSGPNSVRIYHSRNILKIFLYRKVVYIQDFLRTDEDEEEFSTNAFQFNFLRV